MDIKFEYLELLPTIKELLISNNSPYLSRKELSQYIKVSESFIKQRVYDGTFIDNVHYFKITNAKIIFDKKEIDKWVRAKHLQGDENVKPIRKKQQDLSQYISQWTKSHKIDRSK